ncbi:amidohydrolase family protein [Catellatospora sp. KI3]|uniref:amidohydrolase family protein n=1 Tax=Catellatospora sp. KI3 TaxID=3041620 RepID=UPI002482361F|nr:amidohydrolase family protein [Catellatospora sp. KI3]MDI1460803.1 amidohydrolase family protein [Catellatospora sp. KI3]
MPATVISNVRVFDGAQLGAPTTVLLHDGLIGAGPAPRAAEHVDGRGGALLPGFIDTHAHIDDAAQLRAMAQWGVTTVLDMGAAHLDATMSLKDRPGLPTLKTAGRVASGPGSMFITKMGFPASTGVTGPGDAARFVADRVAERSDYLKIIVEDPKIPGSKPLPADTVAALVTAAHAAGLCTVAHVVSIDTLRTALTAGVDIVTHTPVAGTLDDSLRHRIAESDVAVIPTLAMMDGVVHTIGGRLPMRLLSLVVPGLRMRYHHAESVVAAFAAAGRAILVGTDANSNHDSPFQPPYGQSLHDELARLVAAGLTPAQALRGATSLAADTFALTDRGTISPGSRADVVLIDGDPTRDIAATRAIRGVWIAGDRVRPEGTNR